MFAGPCIAATILICSSGIPKPKCSPFSELLILFRNLPSAIGIMSYSCLTCAGFFASWLNSLSFQSDLVYTSCASAALPAVPKVTSAATPVAAVVTNDLRFILFIALFKQKGLIFLLKPCVCLNENHEFLPKLLLESGSSRMRLPVATKIALHSAGTNGGTPGSPTPAGGASLSTRQTLVW